ncbi:MAG: hypothetical protein IPJ98_26230 [Bryobacterales bacterium]|nr:hypothetical protein [Bryobacterales bacterium]
MRSRSRAADQDAIIEFLRTLQVPPELAHRVVDERTPREEVLPIPDNQL